MRWLLDTSVWARRRQPRVAEEIERIHAEGGEFVLSPPVLLEMLRAPQGPAVSDERERVLSAMELVSDDAQTARLAADAMVRLAEHSPTAHRRSVTDLMTAALAHQHGIGVLHADADYALIAAESGLEFSHHRCQVGDAEGPESPEARQRRLRREMSQLLHQLPVEKSEALLRRFIGELESEVKTEALPKPAGVRRKPGANSVELTDHSD